MEQEQQLIQRLKAGDQHSFKTVVDTYQNIIYNTCLGIVKNENDAEDLAQDVFIQVYQSIQSFKGDSKLLTWMYKIAISKCLDFERKKKRKKRFGFVKSIFGENNELVVDTPDFEHPGIQLDQKENAKVLFKTLEQLPENQRIAFVLNKLDGLSYKEVADIMETTVSTIESLLHRAKKNLKKYIEDYLQEKK